MRKKNKSAASEAIRVCVRVRPLKEDELKRLEKVAVKVDLATNQVIVEQPVGDPHLWAFDAVFNNTFSQKDLFSQEAKPLVDQVLDGYNATMFAYGQSGSGKTHTMTGDVESGDPAKYGMMPQVTEYLFDQIRKNTSTTKQFKVKVSYIELYNGKTRDLLGSDPSLSLDIREGPSGFYVKGANVKEVSGFKTCIDEFMFGTDRRATAATDLNAHSSRSHALFSLMVEQFDYEHDAQSPTISSSKMIIVDLAGSEKLGKTNAQGATLVEGCNINASLSALGTCIDKIVTSGPNAHIPFRANPLTRLLKDSLGGNSKTVMFANCGPSHVNISETMSTLRFADNAKKIENKPIKNIDPMKLQIMELQEQIAELKKRVSGDWDPEAEKKLQEQIDELTLENESLKQSVGRGNLQSETDLKEAEKRAGELEAEAAALKKELGETQRDREDVRTRLTYDLQHAESLRSIAANFLRRVMSEEQIKIISDHIPASVGRSDPAAGTDAVWTIGEVSAYFDGFVQLYEEWRNTAYTQEDLHKETARVKSELDAHFANKLEVLERERDQLVTQRDESKKEREAESDAASQLRAEVNQLREENAKLREKVERDQDKFKKKMDKVKEDMAGAQAAADAAKADADAHAGEIERLKKQLEEGGGGGLGGSLSGSGSMAMLPANADDRTRKLASELDDAVNAKKALELRLRQMNLHLRRKGICVTDASALLAGGVPPPPPPPLTGDADADEAAANAAADGAFTITDADMPVPDGDVVGLLQQQLRVQHRLQELNHNHQKKLDLLMRKYEMVRTGQVTKLDIAADSVSSEQMAAKQVELDTLRSEMEKKLEKLTGKLNKKAGEFEMQLKSQGEEKQALEDERNELVHHVDDLGKFNQQIALEVETLRSRMQNQEREAASDTNLLRGENDTLKNLVSKLEGQIESTRLKVSELDEIKRDHDKLQRAHERTEAQLREKLQTIESNHEMIRWSEELVAQERRKVEEAHEQLAQMQAHLQQAEEEFNARFVDHENKLIAMNNQRMQEHEAHFLGLIEDEKAAVQKQKKKVRAAKDNEQRAEKKYEELLLENDTLQIQFEEEKKIAMKSMMQGGGGGGGGGGGAGGGAMPGGAGGGARSVGDIRDDLRSKIQNQARPMF